MPAGPTSSRREFLAVAAAGAGTLAAACRDGATGTTATTPGDPTTRGRVVVVGAGLAGLVAAYDLRSQAVDVVVLEASGRAGGRIRTVRDPFVQGQYGEAGAEFADADDHATLDLLADLALDVSDAAPPVQGADVVVAAPGVPSAATRVGYLALDGGAVGADLARWVQLLETIADHVDPDDPTGAPDAGVLDATSVSTLLDQAAVHAGTRFLVERELVARYGVAPGDLSGLFLAQQAAREAARTAPGGRSFRVAGGTDRIVSRLLADLAGAVSLDSPVTAVRETVTGVEVDHAGGTTGCDAVVLAVPLTAARRIRFDPPAPAAWADAAARLGYGASVVAIVQYGSRPWQAAGLSGSGVCGTPVATTSTLDGEAGAAGIVTGICGGADAVALGVADAAARAAAVSATVDVFLPGSSAGVVGSASVVWYDDPWVGGRGVVFGPGQVLPYWDVLRRPFGRVHPAGEHTDSWCGTLEGAVRSGRRAAAAVVESLGG